MMRILIAAAAAATIGLAVAACAGSTNPGNGNSGNSSTSPSATVWYNSYNSGTVIEYTQPADGPIPVNALPLPGGYYPTPQTGQPADVGSLVCDVSFDGGTTSWHVFTDSSYGNGYVSPTASAFCQQLEAEPGASY